VKKLLQDDLDYLVTW